MHSTSMLDLVRHGTLDAESAALLWLLTDGGVPVVVTGPATLDERSAVASGLVSVDSARRWVVLDADAELLTTERLSALLRGGVHVGVTLAASDLAAALERLTDGGLPEDAVRRLGVVVVAEETGVGLRCPAVHYLRPTERDAQGHVQRRPPAVLSARDDRTDTYEHYAWGITPELADRVDRSQADFEERQRGRAAFIASAARDTSATGLESRLSDYLAAEPPRQPAPTHEPAEPSPFHGGLTDPH